MPQMKSEYIFLLFPELWICFIWDSLVKMIKPEHTDLESKCVTRSRVHSADNYDSKRLTICIYKVAQADWQTETKTQEEKKRNQ